MCMQVLQREDIFLVGTFATFFSISMVRVGQELSRRQSEPSLHLKTLLFGKLR